jgi:hypothetical protein
LKTANAQTQTKPQTQMCFQIDYSSPNFGEIMKSNLPCEEYMTTEDLLSSGKQRYYQLKKQMEKDKIFNFVVSTMSSKDRNALMINPDNWIDYYGYREQFSSRNLCWTCDTLTKKRCLLCETRYCSQACQKANWKEHKEICSCLTFIRTGQGKDLNYIIGKMAFEVLQRKKDNLLLVDPPEDFIKTERLELEQGLQKINQRYEEQLRNFVDDFST